MAIVATTLHNGQLLQSIHYFVGWNRGVIPMHPLHQPLNLHSCRLISHSRTSPVAYPVPCIVLAHVSYALVSISLLHVSFALACSSPFTFCTVYARDGQLMARRLPLAHQIIFFGPPQPSSGQAILQY